MSITISTDVFCDECGDWIHGTAGPRADVRGARAKAAMFGWKVRRNAKHRDLCPECAAPAVSPEEIPSAAVKDGE